MDLNAATVEQVVGWKSEYESAGDAVMVQKLDALIKAIEELDDAKRIIAQGSIFDELVLKRGVGLPNPEPYHAFIWESVPKLSFDEYFDAGGAVIFAKSLNGARELLSDHVPTDCGAFESDPDGVFPLQGAIGTRRVFLFPEARA